MTSRTIGLELVFRLTLKSLAKKMGPRHGPYSENDHWLFVVQPALADLGRIELTGFAVPSALNALGENRGNRCCAGHSKNRTVPLPDIRENDFAFRSNGLAILHSARLLSVRSVNDSV